jgi:catalase
MAKIRKNPPSGKGAAKSTVSGPRRGPRGTNGDGADPAVAKMQKTQALAAAFPFNRNKPGEFGDAARTPKPGATAEPPDASVTASTLTEQTESPKTGAPLDRVRVDSGGQGLTTNFGHPIADNQNSLKAGLRGPALLEDFILREKITHFDHERIPERIVHARGSAAHGVFECYASQAKYTRAAFLAEKGSSFSFRCRSEPAFAASSRTFWSGGDSALNRLRFMMNTCGV